MTRKLHELIQFGLDNNLEVISFGLAPNAFGFSFESHGDASDIVKRTFSDELDSLSPIEVEQLRRSIR